MIMGSGQPSASCDSAATRRRQRRLRSWLRHERGTVALALAEKLHHSAQRPEIARAGEWGARDELYGDDPGHPLLLLPSTHTHQPELFSLYDEEPGGGPRRVRIPHLVRAAGTGSATHRAADCGCCPFVSDSRRSCATDVGTVARHPPFLACSLT